MKKVKNILLFLYCEFLLIAGIIYVMGDYFEVDMAMVSDTETSKTSMYIVQMVMILWNV